ncbi:MAG: hypothetical protein JW755_09055 [Candidatus Aminicenantes bacterium]|nr:hypothetical protein [Candidatus Aminicenantes bacterium]
MQIQAALDEAVYVILRTQCHEVALPCPPALTFPQENGFQALSKFAKLPGLFTRRGCCHGKAAAHEIVVVYIE